MNHIRIFHSNKTGYTEIQEQEPLLVSDLLIRHSIPAAFPCGGTGTCGKCRVRVTGVLSPLSDQERKFLTTDEISQGVRLACRCKILGSAELHLFSVADEVIVDWAETSQSTGHPMDHSTAMRLSAVSGVSSLCTDGPDAEKRGAYGQTQTGIPSTCSRSGSSTAYLQAGIACDLGTTTVAMRLYDLNSGRLLAKASAPNSQRAFGADVISRITACGEHGTERLSTLIAGQLDRMARQCFQNAGLHESALKKTVLTGNTTMLHIWEGLAPSSLAVSPFTRQSSFGTVSRKTLLGSPVYLPECAGAYVGADVLCAALAAGMLSDQNVDPAASPAPAHPCVLLTDIGTNGEMALALPDGGFLCCSAPAGPVFEGAGISMGMNASAGAVSEVRVDPDNHMTVRTIDNAPAMGLCGSGLVDCVAVMKMLQAMDSTGFLANKAFKLPGTCVSVTQADIRQVQLAKAAIRAGISALLHKANITADQISIFYIAGGFGSYLNLDSACLIGLFPPALRTKATFIGNAALEGASLILLDEKMKALASVSAINWQELHLAADPFFMDEFIQRMDF